MGDTNIKNRKRTLQNGEEQSGQEDLQHLGSFKSEWRMILIDCEDSRNSEVGREPIGSKQSSFCSVQERSGTRFFYIAIRRRHSAMKVEPVATMHLDLEGGQAKGFKIIDRDVGGSSKL